MRLDAHARGPFKSLRVKRTPEVFVPNISELVMSVAAWFEGPRSGNGLAGWQALDQ